MLKIQYHFCDPLWNFPGSCARMRSCVCKSCRNIDKNIMPLDGLRRIIGDGCENDLVEYLIDRAIRAWLMGCGDKSVKARLFDVTGVIVVLVCS